MGVVIILLALAVMVALGAITAAMAHAKGYPPGEWFILGCMWGLVAILRMLWKPSKLEGRR